MEIKIKNKTLKWPKDEEEFIKILSLADEAYYLSDIPLMDDLIYDALRDDFKKKFPENAFHSKVGSPEKYSFKKENHSIPMGSQAKINTQEELNFWIKNTLKEKTSSNLNLIWSEKLDGLSVSLEYKNGVLNKALTRGDGVQGKNITVNVLKMKNIPLKIKNNQNLTLRGEIILTKENFKKFFPEKSNPRNAAAGLVNRLDGVGCEHLNILFYDLIGPDITKEQEKFSIIEDLGFDAPKWGVITADKVENLWASYNKKRESLDFEMDGLILTIEDIQKQKQLGIVDNRPKFSRAFKFSSEAGITDILSITWQVGRSGRITPVAEISPISLSGATLSRVSLHNLDELKRLNIKINQKVKIVRSGDVIPKILETLSDGDELIIPKNCPSCSKETSISSGGNFLLCENSLCPEKKIQEIVYFIATLKIDGVGEELVHQLFNNKLIKNSWDIFDLKKGDIKSLSRQGEKSESNALKEIKKASTMTPDRFLSSLGINNLAKETSKILIKNFETIERTLEASLEDLIKIKGIGEKTALIFHENFKDKKSEILDYLNKVKIEYQRKEEGIFSGKSFCFTGFRDKELEEKILKNGGEISSGVSKSTNFLVCLDKNKKSSKIDKAKKLEITILNKEELEDLL